MGKWQDEYEHHWEKTTKETLRARFGRGYARYEVTTADKYELRDLLRAMGSSFDPLAAQHEPVKPTFSARFPNMCHVDQRSRRSSVRFQTSLAATHEFDQSCRASSVRHATAPAPPPPPYLDSQDYDDDYNFPATQVLTYTQPEQPDGVSSDGDTSDTSMQSDVSYVYQTPQPKQNLRKAAVDAQRRIRQRSPAAAVSSMERQHKRASRGSLQPLMLNHSMGGRSSTSTFPAFTPRDLPGSHGENTSSSTATSHTLRRRMASMSPIATRLRFSVDSALNESSQTTNGKDESSLVLFRMETQTIIRGRESDGLDVTTPQLMAPHRRDGREQVVDLDVSMQEMQLSGDETAEDGDVEMTKQEVGEEEERQVAAALDFKDMSDDEEDDAKDVTAHKAVVAIQQQETRPAKSMQWHWSETTMQGETEAAASEPAPVPLPTTTPTATAPPPEEAGPVEEEIIHVDDNDQDVIPEPEPETMQYDEEVCGETEAPPLESNLQYAEPEPSQDPMSKMLTKRLLKAGLAMSDDEDKNDGKDVNPFESSTASVEKGSPTASSSSSSSPTRDSTRKTYYRTKLPLEVESCSTNVDDRRRERRQKLKKKLLATSHHAFRVPECNVDLAPYQQDAVQWMLHREAQPQTSDAGEKNRSSASSARQRELYYDRLTTTMRGGILADEMGLGKTVCCIALICESLKKIREDLSSESSATGGSSTEELPRLKAPTLIITPLSILGQWEKEIREKTNLSVISYQGHTRRQIQNVMDFMGVDVVLSTYDTLRLKECKVKKRRAWNESRNSDLENGESEDVGAIFDKLNDSREWHTVSRRLSNSKRVTTGSKLHQLTWHRVILDESHLITNPSCARAKAALFLKSKRRWCVTGTPIQNSGKDLSSLMNFLGMSHVAADLDFHEVLSRVMLRRLKSTVDAESNEPIVQLPDKVEEMIELEFATDLEKAYYTLLHRSTKQRVFEYLRQQGRGGGGGGQFMHVFELLLRLRQCCDSCALVSDDPRGEVQDGNGALLAEIGTLSKDEAALLARTSAAAPARPLAGMQATYSTKIAVLLNELTKMKQNDERGLVVSQWTSFLDLIAKAIQDRNARSSMRGDDANVLSFCRLDGRMSSREREQAIASFQVDKRVDVLLVSIRTGGLGLNLTAASQVFIMEPSWNPSIESQAVDRAHRVGQKRRVRIVRFLMKHTIEERVVELQRKKRELATATLGDGLVASSQAVAPPKETALSRDELRGLFSQDREVGDDHGHDHDHGTAETTEDDESMEGAVWDDME